MNDPRAQPSRRSLYTLVGIVAVAGLAYTLRGVLVPLFFAFLIAYALDPLVDRIERAKIPRVAGAPFVIVSVIAVVLTLVFVGIPALADEFADASRRLPEQFAGLHSRLDDFSWQHFHYRTPASISELLSKYGAVLQTNIPDASQVGTALGDTVKSVIALISVLVVPVFAAYLLTDFDRIIARAGLLIPRRWAPSVTKIVGEIHVVLGRYVRGQLICCLVLAALYAIGLKIVGIRLAIPIGVLTGMLAFIPYIGLAIGFLLAVTMALLDFHSTGQVVAVLAVMGSVGLLDSMVITPRIVGGSVGLKPIETLLTMMAAATLFGFLGVLLAVPLGAVLKILTRHAMAAYVESGFYRQPPRHHEGESVLDIAPPGAPPDLREEVPSLAPAKVVVEKPIAEGSPAS